MTSEDYTMMRTIIGTMLALLAFIPRVAQAQTEQVFYYHTDAIGSVRMITNDTGQVVARYDYLPFGEPCELLCGTDPAPDQRRQFAGKERDHETGLDYFGARYYASQTGRFTTTDPMLDQQKALPEPQRWNRYAYALNNPLKFVDPDGREPAITQRQLGFELPKWGYWAFGVSTVAGTAVLGGPTAWRAAVTCFLSPSCQSSTLGTLEGLASGGPTTTASAFGFAQVEGVIEGFTYGRLANGAEVAARFSRTGDTLTTSILGAFNAEGAKASGTLSAILQGAQTVARDQGAKQLVVQAVGVVNQRLADILVKQGFRQTTIRVGKESITAYEKLFEVD